VISDARTRVGVFSSTQFIDWLESWNVGKPPRNLWLGVSVENQKCADIRIPKLLETPAAVRFLSVEPLLSSVALVPYLGKSTHQCKCQTRAGVNPLGFHETEYTLQNSGRDWFCIHCNSTAVTRRACDWVIVGGESGKDLRDCGVEAITDVAEQCQSAGVPVYVKQDCAFKSGQQGRIPEEVWNRKEFPELLTAQNA
jgi:hypothetical protein